MGLSLRQRLLVLQVIRRSHLYSASGRLTGADSAIAGVLDHGAHGGEYVKGGGEDFSWGQIPFDGAMSAMYDGHQRYHWATSILWNPAP